MRQRCGSGDQSRNAQHRCFPSSAPRRATPRHATPQRVDRQMRSISVARKQTNKQTNKPAPRRAPPSAVVNYCARVGSARRHALHVAKAGRSVYVCVRTCACVSMRAWDIHACVCACVFVRACARARVFKRADMHESVSFATVGCSCSADSVVRTCSCAGVKCRRCV